jgi:hypothetical protein
MRSAVLVALALVLTACGARTELTGVAPYGEGPRWRPGPGAAGPGCEPGRTGRDRVHLELFAQGKVMVVPAGIGIADPVIDGAYARGGRCRHALFTTEPTGVIEVAEASLQLGDLFRIWDRPLSADRLLDFRAPVRAHVNGRPYPGDPRTIPLTDEAQIVVQAGGPPVEPHADYVFP